MRRTGPLTAQDRAEIVRFRNFLRHPRKVVNVSIQIRDAANPAARQEVTERIGDLMRSVYQFVGSDGFAPEEMAKVRAKVMDQVKTLYHALTGYEATGDELGAMIDPVK